MSGQGLQQIVLGGGLSGWLAALVLARHLRGTGIGIHVDEQEDDASADVLYAAGHDAVLPFLRQLGLSERILLGRCSAGYTLGVRFEELEDMSLGGVGLDWEGVSFLHHLRRCRIDLSAQDALRFSTGAVAMQSERFAPLDARNRIGALQHGVGVHLDPLKLRGILRSLALAAGARAEAGESGSRTLRIETSPLSPVSAERSSGRAVPYTKVLHRFERIEVALSQSEILAFQPPQEVAVDEPWEGSTLRIGPASMLAPPEVFGGWRLLLQELAWLTDLLPADEGGGAEAREYGRLHRAAREELSSMSGLLRTGRSEHGQLFAKRGFLPPADSELFTPLDWTKAYLARGTVPQNINPLAERSPLEAVQREIALLEQRVAAVAASFPPYGQYLEAVRRAAGA